MRESAVPRSRRRRRTARQCPREPPQRCRNPAYAKSRRQRQIHLRICQSSCESPWGTSARAVPCSRPLAVRIGRLLLHGHECVWQDEISGRRQFSSSTLPATTRSDSAPRLRASAIQSTSPSEPSGPGSNTAKGGHAPRLDSLAQLGEVGLIDRVADIAGRQPEHARPVDVRRIHRRHFEPGRRRLDFLLAPPADADRFLAAQQFTGETMKQEQFFM